MCFGQWHVFSDQCDQCNPLVAQQISSKQAEAQEAFRVFCDAGRGQGPSCFERTKKKQEPNDKLKEQFLAVMENYYPLPSQALCAACTRVRGSIRYCDLRHAKLHRDGHIVYHVQLVSPSCTSWSSQGKQLGWMDSANCATLCWAATLRAEQPDLLLLECTKRFDWRFVAEMCDNKLDFFALDMEPDFCGIPTNGGRLWLSGTQAGPARPN